MLSPPTAKHDCTDDTPACSSQASSPLPVTLPFVDQISPTCQTGQFSHHLHGTRPYTHPYTRPTVETRVSGTVSWGQGGVNANEGGAVQPFHPCVRGGGGIKSHLSDQQELYKYVCFSNCNEFLTRQNAVRPIRTNF